MLNKQGFISDGIPIFGYKRRSYLALAGLLGFLSWFAMGTVVSDSWSAIVAIFFGSAAVAVSDVVADSIVVELSRDAKNIRQDQRTDDLILSEAQPSDSVSGDLQSLCWTAAAVGGIMSAYFSGSLLQILTAKQVFMITAIFPLIISVSSIFINESKQDASAFNAATFQQLVVKQVTQLKDTITNPAIYLPILFIFLWRSTPSPDSAMFYFASNELGFKPEFFGRINLAASIASLCGVLTYRTFLRDVSSKSIIFWASILSSVLGLTQVLLVTHFNRTVGIPDSYFAVTDTVVLTVLGQVAFMPTLVLAASLCPPGIEGTLFATLMSIENAGGILSSELGAGLTNVLGITESKFDNLPWLVVLCSISGLIPLPFINLIDKANDLNAKTGRQ